MQGHCLGAHQQDQHTYYQDHVGGQDYDDDEGNDDGVDGEEDEGDDDGNYTRDGRSPPISKAITASNLFV